MSSNVERLRPAFQPRSSLSPWCNGPAQLLDPFSPAQVRETQEKQSDSLQVFFGQWIGEHVLMFRKQVSQGIGPAIVQQVHPMGNPQ